MEHDWRESPRMEGVEWAYGTSRSPTHLGVLAGFVRHAGRWYYAFVVQESTVGETWRVAHGLFRPMGTFAAVELSKPELDRELTQERLFAEMVHPTNVMVGNRIDLNAEERRRNRDGYPLPTAGDYFAAHPQQETGRRRAVYRRRKPAGWFVEQ